MLYTPLNMHRDNISCEFPFFFLAHKKLIQRYINIQAHKF